MPYNPGDELELSPRDATEGFEFDKLTPSVIALYDALSKVEPLRAVSIHESIVDEFELYAPAGFDPDWLSQDAREAWDRMQAIEAAWANHRRAARRARLNAETADIASTLMARG